MVGQKGIDWITVLLFTPTGQDPSCGSAEPAQAVTSGQMVLAWYQPRQEALTAEGCVAASGNWRLRPKCPEAPAHRPRPPALRPPRSGLQSADPELLDREGQGPGIDYHGVRISGPTIAADVAAAAAAAAAAQGQGAQRGAGSQRPGSALGQAGAQRKKQPP